MESYFTLFESLLASKSNPLLAVEELHFAKQRFLTSIIGSMERERDTLSRGKTAKPSSASLHMMN